MKYGTITSGDLKGVWRIILAVVVCELLGGLISMAIGFHHFWFMNLWLGGAIGSLPGFVIGAIWQFSGPSGRRGSAGVAWFGGLLALAIAGIACGVVFPLMRMHVTQLSALAHLRDESIHSIVVFDRYGDTRLVSLSDQKALLAFAEACVDGVGHTPNHPTYSDSWYVVVSGNSRHEFELHLDPKFPSSVIGDFVLKSGNTTTYQGAFESHGLRSWIEKYVMQEGPNRAPGATR
jgi:hypothetical protein